MVLLKEDKTFNLQKIKIKIYCEKTGLSRPFVSGVINRRFKCTENVARSLLSVAFDISFNGEEMENKLKEYFEEE